MPSKRRRKAAFDAEDEKENKRPKRYKEWSDVSMENALRAVKEGEMGVNRAALEFGIPKTTLKDRLSGRVQHGKAVCLFAAYVPQSSCKLNLQRIFMTIVNLYYCNLHLSLSYMCIIFTSHVICDAKYSNKVNIPVVDFKCILNHSVVEITLPWSKLDNFLINGPVLYFSDSNEYVIEILNINRLMNGLRNDV